MILYKNNIPKNIDDLRLSQLCLDLSGGGFSFAETSQAMIYQDELNRGNSVTVKGNTYRLGDRPKKASTP